MKGWGDDKVGNREVKSMTLQEWLEQEEVSWIKSGSPDGWSSGWSKERVRLGQSKYSVKVIFYTMGYRMVELDNQEVSK